MPTSIQAEPPFPEASFEDGERGREEGGMDESTKAQCREMFEKVTEYLNGELAGGCV